MNVDVVPQLRFNFDRIDKKRIMELLIDIYERGGNKNTASYVDDLTFYYTGEEGGPDQGVTGDVNGDGEVNISDVNAVIDMLLKGVQDASGDVNGDGEVNIADVNAIIDIILNS